MTPKAGGSVLGKGVGILCLKNLFVLLKNLKKKMYTYLEKRVNKVVYQSLDIIKVFGPWDQSSVLKAVAGLTVNGVIYNSLACSFVISFHCK